MDRQRTGDLPFVFEPGFGFERYVEYILDVPMYFLYRNGTYVDTAGHSFRDFVEARARRHGATAQHSRATRGGRAARPSAGVLRAPTCGWNRALPTLAQGKLAILPGQRPTMDDYEAHLTTAFPEARQGTPQPRPAPEGREAGPRGCCR